MSAPLGVTVDDLLTEAGQVYAGLHAPALAELIQLRVQVRQQADEITRLRAQIVQPAETAGP